MADPAGQSDPHPWAERLRRAAFLLLLACVVSRCFVSEQSFRMPPIDLNEAFYAIDHESLTDPVNREDLARTWYTTSLLSVMLLWGLAHAIDPQRWKAPWWLLALLALAVLAGISAIRANDSPSAWSTWWDQLAILLAGFVAAQLCDRPSRWRVLLLAILTVGTVTASKGLYQHFVELPAMHDQLAANPDLLSGVTGTQPGTPEAAIFLERARQNTPTGYFAMGNALASLLLLPLLAIPGVIVAILRTTQDRVRAWGISSLLAILAGGILYCILLTASRGALAAGISALLVGLGVLVIPKGWRRRRRVWLIGIVAGLLLLGAAAMAMQYNRTGSAPGGASMGVRWQYWSATGDILRGNELFGVGGGNYATHYLQHRALGAAEAVQTPHNVGVHAIAQFGLLGGIVYLGILAGVLIALTRPVEPHPLDASHSRSTLSAVPITGLAVAIAICSFHSGAVGAMALYFALPPAIMVSLVFGLMLWVFRDLDLNAPVVRVMVVIAIMAFALHNLVSYSLWMPATATAFWVLAGSALAQWSSRGWIAPRWTRVATPLLAATILIACIATYLAPTIQRTHHWRTIARLLREQQYRPAGELASRAFAESRDPATLDQAARLCIAFANDPTFAHHALTFATRAVELEPTNPDLQQLLSQTHWRLNPTPTNDHPAFGPMVCACELDPQNAGRFLSAAQLFADAHQPTLAAKFAREGLKCDDALPPTSLYRLTSDDRTTLEQLASSTPTP
jgi:hypothetical protein